MLWITASLTFLLAVLPFLNGYSDEDVNAYMEYALADYQVKLHRTAQIMPKRIRRDITTEDFLLKPRTAQMSDIKNITPWQSIPTSYPVELEPFVINNDNYMAVVNFKNKDGSYRTDSLVYILNGTQFRLLQNFSTSGGIDFEFADLGREQYAIFLDHVGQNWYGGTDKYTYMKSFQVNQFLPSEGKDKPFKYRTKVRALGAKKVKVFTKNNKHYFVTANSYHKSGNLYHVKSTMHLQTAYGYQLVQEFLTQGAQDVEVEVINGRRFIFFANKMDNAGNVDIYSIIYSENPEGNLKVKNPFKLYQRIGTHGARDFEYFTFGGNHYLAVANEYTQVKSMDANTGRPITVNDYTVDSVIYWWTGTMWVQWQLIPTNGAVKWSYFTSSFGDPMLVVANTKAPPVIFTYDPLRGIFIPTHSQDLSPFPGQPDIIADVRSVMPFTTKDNGVFLAVANYDPQYTAGYNIFKLTFEMRPVKELEPSIPEIITDHLEKMREELRNLQLSLTALLEEVTNKVMTKSTEQNITSSVYLKNVTITGTLTTAHFFYRKSVTNSPMLMLQEELARLASKLEEQQDKILLLEAKYEDAVRLNQDTKITGKKTFTENVHVNHDFVTNKMNIGGLLDETKLDDLHARTLKKSTVQTVEGNYTFIDEVKLFDAQVEKLNGQNVSSLMTTNTEQVITGTKTFNETTVIDEMNLGNFTVNNLRIPEDIVTQTGNRTITGQKDFNTMKIKNLDINGLMNGINITDFYLNKMTLTTNQAAGSVIFNDGFSSTTDLYVGGKVDGVNLTAIGMDMSGKIEEVEGPKTFRSIVVKGSAIVNKLNGYDLNESVTLNTTQVITSNVVFKSDVNITGHLITNSTINDMHLSKQVVLKHGNQSINGHKTMTSDMSVLQNITTEGKVDGVNLQEWDLNAIRTDNKNPITGLKRFTGGVNITDQLNVNTLNNITLGNLRENIISIKSGTTWTSGFNFETLTVNNLSVDGTLNGYKVPDDFVLLNSDGPISGVKTFSDNTTIGGNVSVEGKLSGTNLSAFYEQVLKNNTDETINTDVYFLQNLVVNNLNVTGNINNRSIPDDVMTTNTIQNITTTLAFSTDTTFESSIHADKIVVETVNGIDLSDMEENAIHKDKNQTINGTVIFVGGIDCKQNLSVAGLINGVNLTELLDRTVRVSQAQNITGYKSFTQDVVFEAPLVSPGTINGINISELDQTSWKKGNNQTMYSNVHIDGNVTVTNSVNTNGTRVNDIDFQHFISNAAKTGIHNTIHGNLTYSDGVVVNTLGAEAVDGVNVSEILLTRYNQSVTGHVNFTSLSVGNLNLRGLMDGVDIYRLQSKSLKIRGKQDISGKYTISGVQVNGSVSVSRKINNVNLAEFDSAAMHLTGDEVIAGNKHFRNVTVGDATISGSLNNVDVSTLLDDALRKTIPQRVCIAKTFQNSISTSTDTTVFDVEVTGNVNGVDVDNLFKKAIKLDDEKILRGNYRFDTGLEVDGDVTVKGELNGVDISKDFMTSSGYQNITGFKKFHEVDFDSHLNISGLVNGVNLTHVNRNRVTLSGDQKLGNLRFQSAELDRDLTLPNKSTVNHLDISKDLVPVLKGSTIHGEKLFNSTYIRGDLNAKTGFVNGINLTHLESATVKLSSPTPQTISADQRFEEHVNIQGNLTVNGLVNGVKVSDVQDYSENITNTIKEELQVLSSTTTSLCNATTALMPVAVTEHVLTGIEKVDVFKSFPVDGNLGSIDSTTIGVDIFITIARAPGAVCGAAYVLKCTQDMDCNIHQTIYTNAPKMEFFEYATFKAIVVSHWKSDINDTLGCKTVAEIYVFDGRLGRFVPYQTLNAVLFESDLAPVIASSTILTPYLTNAYSYYEHPSTSSEYERVLPIDIKWFERAGKRYLVIGGYKGADFVDILFIDGKNLASLKMEQRIKTTGRHVSVGKLNSGQSIIATSSDDLHGSIQLFIFNDKTNKFEFYQRLEHSATTVSMQKLQDKHYLFYANPSSGFGLCEWLGVSGYGACTRLESTDTTSVETIITLSGAYAIAGTDKSLMIYKTLFMGNSKLYDKPVC